MTKKFILIISVIFFSGCSVAGDPKALGAEALIAARYAEAYNIWLPLAEGGDPEVQESLALLLISDVDLHINLSKDERERLAMKWVDLSAKSGHKSAMRWIGQSLQNGWHGLDKDSKEANCWLNASDGKGDASDCSFKLK